jgi:hypothetical protein
MPLTEQDEYMAGVIKRLYVELNRYTAVNLCYIECKMYIHKREEENNGFDKIAFLGRTGFPIPIQARMM